MKGLFICLIFALFLVNCSYTKNNKIKENTSLIQDSLVNKIYSDSIEIFKLKQEVKFWKDSVETLDSTINYEDYINARRIEKIKYYIKICENRPTNKKYFFGWIKRTITE